MPLGDLWSRTLVYFGIAEEDDEWDDSDGYAAEESLEQSYRERPNVRRLTPRRRARAPARRQPAHVRALAVALLEALLGGIPVGVVPFVVLFGDAEVDERARPEIAERHRRGF